MQTLKSRPEIYQLNSKVKFKNLILKEREKMYLNSIFFFDCVVNPNQLRQDLKVTEEKIIKDLRGTINFLKYVKLVKF